jgi:LysR family transcriptional regulator, benzoate and cis,cis-muconate-responsive activator of ben and cat genes
MTTTVDPRQLECFVAVAEELNVGRAAARLHMTQPPLTRRIQRLERDVGAALFRRHAGGMELTEAGEALLERSYRIVELSRRAVHHTRLAHVGELGHLTIGYYDSAIRDGIPRVVRDFVQAHPNVTVDFEYAPKELQAEHVRDKLLHIAFGYDYLEQPGIERHRVLSESLYVAMHETRLADWRDPARVADLEHQPLAIYPKTRPAFGDRVIDMCLRSGFTPTISVETVDDVSCLAYVALGTTVAVVRESATKAGTDGVVFIPLIDAPSVELHCIYLAENRSPTLNLFIKHIEAWV